MEKELTALGAETVCGDLILNRITVGRYREGVFIPTPEGKEAIDRAAAKKAEDKARKGAKLTAAEQNAVDSVAATDASKVVKGSRAVVEKTEMPVTSAGDQAGEIQTVSVEPEHDVHTSLDHLLAGTGLEPEVVNREQAEASTNHVAKVALENEGDKPARSREKPNTRAEKQAADSADAKATAEEIKKVK
jgi:hypothetical protein